MIQLYSIILNSLIGLILVHCYDIESLHILPNLFQKASLKKNIKYQLITFVPHLGSEFKHQSHHFNSSNLKIFGFKSVKIYTYDDIDPLFMKRNVNTIRKTITHDDEKHSNSTSEDHFSSGIMKTYVILHHMSYIMKQDDILCYVDFDITFTSSFESLMNQWTAQPPHIGILSNHPKHHKRIERQWTKKDTFILMNLDTRPIQYSPQAWNKLIVIKNNFISFQFIAEWFTYSQNERILLNETSIYGHDDQDFIEHQTDQSILSLLAKKWKIIIRELPYHPQIIK